MITGILANAGTPLMWFGIFHLVIGNLFIGIIEGLILGFMFRLKKFKTIGWMIVANYLSTWVGKILLDVIKDHIDITIYQVKTYLYVMLVGAWLITLLLEFPFVYLATKGKTRRWSISIVGNFVVQTALYALLAAYWYLPVSGYSMVQDVELVKNLNFVQNKAGVIYFIEKNNVCKIALDGSLAEPVMPISPAAHLDLKYNPDTRTTNLIALFDDMSESRQDGIVIIPDVLKNQSQHRTLTEEDVQRQWKTNADDLRGFEERQWDVYSGFWPMEGLNIINSENTKEKIHLALETPFVAWFITYSAVLPEDEVVFQIDRQICIYSRQQNKLAVITKGTSPIVFLTDPSQSQ